MYSPDEVRRLARGYALLNAVEHGGKAAPGPVMGKLMAEKPEWRRHAREIAGIVREVVEEVNKLSLSEQKRILEEEYSWLLERRAQKRVEEKRLPPLPGAEKGRVVTRFAPNPDFVLHLGNARPAILSYEYARMYEGRMILRFEDTDPRIKTPLPEAYQYIRDDLRWLGVKWDEEYIQSLRMSIYYDVARRLIERGGAYVDDMPPEEYRRYRDQGALSRYPPRQRSVEENLELWDRMLEGHYGEGEAVLRVKTDPDHPDPSVRDWVAFRIVDTDRSPHPLTGSRYTVWPTYNFAAGVDDHLMGVTHILRAREHVQNTVKQSFLYKHMGWTYPHVVHFGRLRLEGFVMSKSALRELVARGRASGVDDPRFATLAGLRRRGIVAETVWRIVLDVGVKQTDASVSYANLAALNRSIIDPRAKRVMAALDPVELVVRGLPWSGERVFEIPYHPSGQLGKRSIAVRGPEARLYVSRADLEILRPGRLVRLMEAFNVVVEAVGERVEAKYHSMGLEEARRHNAPIIHWVPAETRVQVELLVPDGLELKTVRGLAEPEAAKLRAGEIVQLVRHGFARVDSVEEERLVLIYAHD